MVMFVGRITKDAVVNQLKDERQVVNFDVAINDYYKSKNSEQGVKTTTYINCTYWISPKIADLLKKGSLVEINGRIYVSAYSAADGEARGSIHCHVNGIKVHGQKGNSLVREVNIKKKNEPVDDLPF